MDSLTERGLLAAFRWQTRHAMHMRAEEKVPPPEPPTGGSSTLYLHVPFCEVLCPFCSFHRVPFREPKARRYFAALRQELRAYHRAGFGFQSLYVGGGTPTCAVDELVETLALVRELFDVEEVSVETNPKDLRPAVLDRLVQVGVDRLSVGVQSFDDGLLKEMGRREKYGSSAEIIERLDAAAPRFHTLNVDMMYNFPHQQAASLEHDLDVLLALRANQVSFYPLMSAPSTEAKLLATVGTPTPRNLRADYQRYLDRLRPTFTPQSGWCFARSAGAIDEYIIDSDHYVGVGSGAFSYVNGTLYSTTFSLEGYADRVERGLTGITARRPLTPSEQMKNVFLTRLFSLELEKAWVRQRYGERFERELGFALWAMKRLGALEEDERSWRLTDVGMYYWVRMMSQFYESVNAFRDAMRRQIGAELLEEPAPLADGPRAEALDHLSPGG